MTPALDLGQCLVQKTLGGHGAPILHVGETTQYLRWSAQTTQCMHCVLSLYRAGG